VTRIPPPSRPRALGEILNNAATESLFVVAEIAGPQHVLYALDAVTGAASWRGARPSRTGPVDG
jgi:hypothetical protein